jgi:hypothetical protein
VTVKPHLPPERASSVQPQQVQLLHVETSRVLGSYNAAFPVLHGSSLGNVEPLPEPTSPMHLSGRANLLYQEWRLIANRKEITVSQGSYTPVERPISSRDTDRTPDRP